MAKVYIFLCFTTLLSCSPAKNLDGDQKCSKPYIVVDKSGLDGCKTVLKNSQGELIFPLTKTRELDMLQDGSLIYADVEIDKNVTTICMAQDYSARISCFAPVQSDCINKYKEKDVTWINKIREMNEVIRIERFEITKDSSLFALSNYEAITLYDCRGNFICRSPDSIDNECMKKMREMDDKGEVVYKLER